MRARSLPIATLVALLSAMVSPAASAASNGESEAEALFRQAKELMDEGRYGEACPKLDRSRTLDRQVGTTLNLALCYERLGKTASSWAMWLDGADEAASKAQVEREALARRRAAQLAPRLLRITIVVTPQPDSPSLDVQLDGVSVPKAQWGTPTPVDPGAHWVQATAEGKRPWMFTVEVDEGHVPTVNVGVLERLETPHEEAPVAARHSGLSARRTAALSLGGLGITAFAGMSALIVVAQSTYSNAACLGANCLQSGVRDRDHAIAEAGLATAAGTVGAAALVGAALLWFGAPGERTGFRIEPEVGATRVGLSMRGGW
jgi:hypothetical protein